MAIDEGGEGTIGSGSRNPVFELCDKIGKELNIDGLALEKVISKFRREGYELVKKPVQGEEAIIGNERYVRSSEVKVSYNSLNEVLDDALNKALKK